MIVHDQNNQITTVKTLPTQQALLECDEKEAAYVGGWACGKTEGLAMWADRQCHLYEHNYLAIAAGTYVQLNRSTIRKVLEFFSRIRTPFHYNKNDKCIKLLDGCESEIVFVTLDVDSTYLQGPDFGGVGVDEAELLEFEHRRKLKSRNRKQGASRQIRYFLNPPPEEHWITQAYREKSFTFFQASMLENETLPDDYVKDMLLTYPKGTPGYRRYITGEIGVPMEGAIYCEFDKDRHIVEPGAVPPLLGYVSAIDFGYANPTCYLRGGLSEDDCLYIDAEFYEARWLNEDKVEAMRRLHSGPLPWADPEDAQSRAEYARLGFPTQPAIKEVVEGINAVKRRLARGKLKFVRGTCRNTIREIGKYVWADSGKEIPQKVNDHAMDALRYLVMGLDADEWELKRGRPKPKEEREED